MRHFIWLSIFLLFAFSSVFGQPENTFIYDDKGRRDPFLPLVDENGRYLLGTDASYSSADLNLSGILWDQQGKSSAIINNEIVEIGASIGGFTVKNITGDSVTVCKGGQEFILKLSIEEK